MEASLFPTRPVIVWFRDDLRLADNPALSAAAASGRPLLSVFVHDEEIEGLRPLGEAAFWWLHGALEAHHGVDDVPTPERTVDPTAILEGAPEGLHSRP